VALAPPPEPLPPDVAEQVGIEAKYAGYIDKQRVEVDRLRRLEDWRIPPDLRYETLSGLRTEAREKLAHLRPATVGQASVWRASTRPTYRCCSSSQKARAAGEQTPSRGHALPYLALDGDRSQACQSRRPATAAT